MVQPAINGFFIIKITASDSFHWVVPPTVRHTWISRTLKCGEKGAA